MIAKNVLRGSGGGKAGKAACVFGEIFKAAGLGFGFGLNAAHRGVSGEYYVSFDGLDDNAFKKAVCALDEREFALISLFCCQNFEKASGLTLFYVFEKRGCESESDILVLHRRIGYSGLGSGSGGSKKPCAQSIAEIFPSACWFERDISDGFGVEFAGAFDKRRLFLHEHYPEGFHPLLKSFKNQNISQKMRKSVDESEEYKFKEMRGEGVYQIPVGPVHAGIIEPGHFRFSVIGETIFNLEVRMFWKHRGIEKLAEGKSPKDCVAIAESISGDETVANSTAFCRAIECISEINVPVRALCLRTVFLEMERIYSHLGDMAGMVIDVAYPAGASPFFILREEMFRRNESLTGSRFMKGIIGIGGLKKDVSESALPDLLQFLKSFSGRFNEAVCDIRAVPSVVDRLETTGAIKKELLRPLNITGPAARASGEHIDSRIDHPYGIYGKLGLKKRALEKGDVLSRFELKASEILDSIEIIQKAAQTANKLEKSESGHEISSQPHMRRISDGYALSVIESPRGQSVHWVYVRNGAVDRYKIRTASFCNWQAIEHAVLGNIVPDFPLINKSLNLSYAGTDL